MQYGSPGHRPMSMSEYVEWVALAQIVEPHEAQKSKAQSRVAGRVRRRG